MAKVYAQPLYLSSVTVNGTAHHVLYIATKHNSVLCVRRLHRRAAMEGHYDRHGRGPPASQIALPVSRGSSLVPRWLPRHAARTSAWNRSLLSGAIQIRPWPVSRKPRHFRSHTLPVPFLAAFTCNRKRPVLNLGQRPFRR